MNTHGLSAPWPRRPPRPKVGAASPSTRLGALSLSKRPRDASDQRQSRSLSLSTTIPDQAPSIALDKTQSKWITPNQSRPLQISGPGKQPAIVANRIGPNAKADKSPRISPNIAKYRQITPKIPELRARNERGRWRNQKLETKNQKPSILAQSLRPSLFCGFILRPPAAIPSLASA